MGFMIKPVKKNIAVILFFIFIFCCTQFMLGAGVLAGDDMFSFIAEEIKINKRLCYGSWVMYVMNALFIVLPYKLDINLQDWCISFGSIFKTAVVTGMFIYIFKFIGINNKSLAGSLSGVFILYALYFIMHSRIFFIDFMINEGFFRFIIPAFLMEIFLYYFYSLYRNEKTNIPALMILAFFTAASSEAAAAILISIVFIAAIYKKRPEYIKIILMLIFGFIVLASTQGFHEHFSSKMKGAGLNFKYAGEFASVFFKNIIWNYIGIHILFAFLCLKNKKIAAFPVFILSGLLMFSAGLFFLGKTGYGGNFWINHNDLFSFFNTIFITALACVFNGVNIKLCILVSAALIYPFVNSMFLLKNTLLNIKDYSYARDKIMLFYEYKNMKPVMPELVKFRMFLSVMTKIRMDVNDCHPIKDTDTKEDEANIQKLFNYLYYPVLYKIQPSLGAEQTIIPDGIEYFKQQGGTLYEIDAGRYKFSDLKDKNFVTADEKRVKALIKW